MQRSLSAVQEAATPPALLLPVALLILHRFRRRAHGRLADLACRETSLLAIVEAPLVADDSAVCGGSLIDGSETGEAREAESNDENFDAFSISYFELQFLFHALSVRGINSRAFHFRFSGTPEHRLTRNLNARA
jgi:hypothetical protein